MVLFFCKSNYFSGKCRCVLPVTKTGGLGKTTEGHVSRIKKISLGWSIVNMEFVLLSVFNITYGILFHTFR